MAAKAHYTHGFCESKVKIEHRRFWVSDEQRSVQVRLGGEGMVYISAEGPGIVRLDSVEMPFRDFYERMRDAFFAAAQN